MWLLQTNQRKDLNMDRFEKWLDDNKEHFALTDASYKNIKQNQEHTATQDGCEINSDLATLGDAVLKLALSNLLWDEGIEKLTEVKKKYESDKILVTVIAKHYNILERLRYNKDDFKNKNKDNYDYDVKSKKKHKYLATAIEACLGAIWLESKDLDEIREIVLIWKGLIDDAEQYN